MDGHGLDVSSKVPLKSMTISERHSHSGSSLSCSLFSENVNGEVPTSAPDMSQRVERRKVNAERITKVHKVNDLGCEGDNISCISKADGTNLEISGRIVDTCRKNLTGSSASVTSSCQEGTEKPIDVQSFNHGSISSECIAEEGNKFRGSPEFARETLQSAADISDKSDPSETSSLRDEHCAVSPKVESVSRARDTDLLTSQKGSHECNDLWKSDAEIDSNQISVVVSNKLDQKQQSKTRMEEDMQETPLQYRVVDVKDDLDELVDVRVCDICGDVGREALLAVCSKCGDGAEHIYCMRIKMDKVPDGDWMCEDCAIVAEAQKPKAVEQRIGRALQKSSTNEVVQTPRKLDLSGDNGRVRVGHSSLTYSRKRPGPSIEVIPPSQKRALDNDVKVTSPSGSYAKAVSSPRHPNLKITTKGEGASSSGPNSVRNTLRKAHEILAGRSSNVESPFTKGPFLKQKSSNSTDLRTDRESEDVPREQKIAKGSATFGAGQQHALTKLMKSKSFNTSSIARIDNLDSKKNMDNDFKIPKAGSKRSMTQRSYSFNAKISQPVSPKVNTSISMAKPVNATPAPVEVKQRVSQTNSHYAPKAAGVRKDLEKATVHRVAKRHCDTNSSGFDKKIPSSLVDKGRSSGTSGKNSTASLGQKSDRKIATVEEEHKLHDVKHQLNDSPAGANVLLASSAHPDVESVWRGMLNVECNKLPSGISGLQAHLSTCASPKAFKVASKLPGEITVKEVLQQDTWPVQFSENRVTENDIALYFFAEDHESYRRYKRILNCMMLNDLALKANLDGIELLMFHSQVLPARSRRWNNLFFLWGVFRAKRSSFPDDVSVPSPREGIRIPKSESATSPKNCPVLIPAISGPVNLDIPSPREGIRIPKSESAASPKNRPVLIPAIPGPVNLDIPAEVGQGSSPVEAVSGSILGSGSSSQRDLQSSVSTKSKCVEGISVDEVSDRTMESAVIEEQHSGELQPINEGQKETTSSEEDPGAEIVEALQAENTSPDQDPEVKTVEVFQTETTSQDQDRKAKTVEASQTENASQGEDPEAKTVEAFQTENASHGEDPEAKNVEVFRTVMSENTPQDQDPQAKTAEARPCVSGAEIPEQPTGGIDGMKDISSVTGGRLQAGIAFNYPCNWTSSVIDVNIPVCTDDDMNVSTISLNSSPSDSGGEGTSKKPRRHTFDLELPLPSENEPVNNGYSDMALDQPNGNADYAIVDLDGFVSLDLSLALPSTDAPVLMMEDLLPDMNDDVDTSLSLSFGGKRA